MSVLLDALDKVDITFEANFYGRGEIRPEWAAKVKKINAKIIGTYNYEDLPKIIQSHDIFIFPSLVPEAFGRVAVAWMHTFPGKEELE